MKALDFLGSPANLAGAGAAIVVGAGAAVLGAAPLIVVAGALLAYSGGLLIVSPRTREIRVSVGGDDRAAVEAGLAQAREQLAAQRGGLPAAIAERADALLVGIGELMPRWSTDMVALTEERTVVRSILADYLPTSLNAYLALPRSYLTRARTAAERETQSQLDLLVDTVHGIQNQVFDGVEQKIRAQSQFLRDKFSRGGGLQL